MRATRKIIGVTVVALTLFGSAANLSAASRKHVRHHGPDVVPSADAVELGTLAPPSRLSTFAQAYGDAAIARSRAQRRQRFEEGANADDVPYPCDPRQAESRGYVCWNDPSRIGYGQFYALTPSYVSAPQIVGVAPDIQAPVLSPITSFFWAVNSARIDPH